MSRFLRLCAVLSAMFFTANAFAAGYVCNDIKQYTSCYPRYYMANSASDSTYNGTPKVGNACLPCPSDATFCPGGTAAPLYKVTLDFNGGQNPSGSASNAATTTVYAGADDKWYIGTTSTSAGTLISSTNPVKTPRRNGYYFDGYDGGAIIINQEGTIEYGNASISAPITLVAEWVNCPANSYCDITVENNGVHTCPSPYSKSNAGASSEFDCYLTCAMGARVVSPGDSCTTGDGGWATLAHNVNYGSVSALYMPTYPFINNTSTVAMYHNANLFGTATLMEKFSGEGEPGYKLIGNVGAQANNGFPIYKVRFTNADTDDEWENIVLKELVVLRENTTVNLLSTSPTFGIYDADASAIYENPGTFYISDGHLDITQGGAATDGDSSTYVSMPGGSYLVYSFGSDPVEISRIQVELGFNDDMSEFKIEVDISGNNDWVSITGNSKHDGYNQIDTSAREGTYGEPVSRTLIFPVAALQPCGNGNYKSTSPNTWNNFAQFTGCNSCADIADTNGFYQYTDTTTAGSGAQCFGTTTAGNFVEETSKGEISCKQGYYCPGGSNVYYGNIGKPSTGGSELCPAGSYCPGTSTITPTECPGDYTSDSGASDQLMCYIYCDPGTRVIAPGGECVTDTGAWYTAANRVFYGMLSPALYAPYPFINNNYTSEGAHDFYASDNTDASTGTAPAGYFALGQDNVSIKMGGIPATSIRVTNTGSAASLYEISAFEPDATIMDEGFHLPSDSLIYDKTPASIVGANNQQSSRLTDGVTPHLDLTHRTIPSETDSAIVFAQNASVTYNISNTTIGAIQIIAQGSPSLKVELYSSTYLTWVTIYDAATRPLVSKPISADAVNTMILPATAWLPCSTGQYKPALSTSPITWTSIMAYQTCNSCSALNGTNGFYSKTSSTGSSAATQCFGTTTAGYAVTTANKAETQCSQNNACPGGTNVFYGSTGGSETCPVDTYSAAGATACSACPAYTNQLGEYGIIKAPAAGCIYALVFGNSSTENNAVLENWSSATFNSAAIQVNPDYDANSEYNKSGVHVIIRTFSPANPTAERWNIAQNYGCNAGYYRPNATGLGAIGSSENLEELTANFCQPAEKGYWSPGITNTTWENMTLENMGVLRNTCPAGYDDGSATAGAENQCQTSCGAGTAVLEPAGACTVIDDNAYKTGTALVNFGSISPTASDITSGWAADTIYSCPNSYSISGTAATNHDARTDCSISCAAGTQVASANAACTTPTGSNWYTSKHDVSAGSTSGSNIKQCKTDQGYATANTATATDHDNMNDCKTTCAPGQWVESANTACTDVTNGYYTTASQTISQGNTGSRSQCSALNAFYTNSDNGRNATADCYGYATATKYVAETGKGAVACTGGYCPGDSTTKIYYASGNGATTGGRTVLNNWTCPASADAASDCYRGVTLNKNSMSGTLTLPSSSGCKSIGGATGTTSDTVYVYNGVACKLPTTALSATATGTTYNSTGSWGTSANAASGFVTSITVTSDDATTPTYYAGKKYTCAAGYYLKANTNGACSECTGGSYCNGISGKYYSSSAQGLSDCATDTTYYKKSFSKADSINKCYLTTTEGKYVKTVNANEEICAGDGYCTGGINVYYGSTGGYEACDTNYRANTNTGKTAATQCQASCGAGTAVLEPAGACTVIEGNTYKTGTAPVNFGSISPTASDITSGWAAGTIYSCPNSYSISGTAATNHDARTDCSISCDAGTQVASANAACTTPTGSNWYTSKHDVSAGSTSGDNVKLCSTDRGYATANTATATDHDNVDDCKTTCAPGQWVASANTACTDVTNGYYTTASQTISQGSAGSRSQCSALNAFYTGSDSNRDANTDCYGTTTAGNFIKTAKSGQVTCDAGGYCPGNVKVYYDSKGGRTGCGEGTYNANTGSSAASACAACATGSYNSGTGNTACTPCQNGTTTSGTGKTSCDATCGNNNNYDNTWKTATWSANSLTNLCTINNCKAGSKYASASGGSCTACDQGSYMNSSAHTNTSCTSAGSGYYVDTTGATSRKACSALTAPAVTGGSFSSESPYNAASTCRYTAPAKTHTYCSSITANTVSYNGSAWGTDFYTTKAKAGSRVIATGNTSAPACEQCAAGTYQGTDGSTATSCTNAEDGKYVASTGASSSTACATGSYSEKSSASTKCIACPKGRTTSGTGTKYNATANTACSVTCSNATGAYAWADPSWSANSVTNLCTVSTCNKDTYYTATTGTGYKNTCTACGANSGNDANNSLPTCTCAMGHTRDGKLTGYNTSTNGCTRISGIACSVGQYLPAQATTCEDCDAGYYCPAEPKDYSFQDYIQGRNECGLGKYQPNKKQTSCLVAEAGYYVPKTAQTQQTKCSNATYQPETGKSSCIACPDPVNLPSGVTVKGKGYWISSGIPTARSGCSVTFNSIDIDDGVMGSSYCYIDEDADSYGMTGTSKNGCYVRRENLTCDGGYYNKTFAENSSATQLNSGKTLATAKDQACTPAEEGYWSAADTLTRTECAPGLVTCGTGKCANEAADCGRKLHMGDNTIYLRSVKRTNPSLNVKVGDTTFYGALSISLSSKAKVKNGSTTYSVVNDYQ